MIKEAKRLEDHILFIKELVKQGGPHQESFTEFSTELDSIAKIANSPGSSEKTLRLIRDALGDTITVETLQGYAFCKPKGYPGDFIMIDKIYQQHVSPKENLKNWDLYFQSQKAPMAVRNRKRYFIEYISRLRNRKCNKKLHILDIASGPCRDVRECLQIMDDTDMHFHCIDYDPNAIDYAKIICKDHLSQITFYHKNVFRFESDQKFDLIWSGGLLDYFNDKQFIFLIKRLYSLLKEEAELIVGNFNPNNPTKNYMEIVGDWYLNYRSECDLIKLALDSGFSMNDIRVGAEEERINCFLHIKNGQLFF